MQKKNSVQPERGECGERGELGGLAGGLLSFSAPPSKGDAGRVRAGDIQSRSLTLIDFRGEVSPSRSIFGDGCKKTVSIRIAMCVCV